MLTNVDGNVFNYKSCNIIITDNTLLLLLLLYCEIFHGILYFTPTVPSQESDNISAYIFKMSFQGFIYLFIL